MKNNIKSYSRKFKDLFFNKLTLLFCLSLVLIGLGILYGPLGYRLPQRNLPLSDSGQKVTEGTKDSRDVLGWGNYRQEPNIYLSGGENGYTAGGMIALASSDEPAVVIGGYQVTGEAEISMYQATEADLLDYLVHDKDGKQIKPKVDSSKMQFVTSTKKAIDTNSYSGSKIPLPFTETGIWYLSVKMGGVNADAYVVRSNVGVIAKEEDNQLIYWGQDFRTKRSISDGTVKLLINY